MINDIKCCFGLAWGCLNWVKYIMFCFTCFSESVIWIHKWIERPYEHCRRWCLSVSGWIQRTCTAWSYFYFTDVFMLYWKPVKHGKKYGTFIEYSIYIKKKPKEKAKEVDLFDNLFVLMLSEFVWYYKSYWLFCVLIECCVAFAFTIFYYLLLMFSQLKSSKFEYYTIQQIQLG